jgi:hypothetical protein
MFGAFFPNFSFFLLEGFRRPNSMLLNYSPCMGHYTICSSHTAGTTRLGWHETERTRLEWRATFLKSFTSTTKGITMNCTDLWGTFGHGSYRSGAKLSFFGMRHKGSLFSRQIEPLWPPVI